ncbi:MAG: hypothetical protein JNJ61_02125 [Anaerolineae bacterium]|nr:hypothetical protein [Anaerolineae bacterium]
MLPITRCYLRILLPLLLFFAALPLLARLQPNNDAGLRALLFPSGCRAPCIFGIRPGQTTGREALDLLETHPWVTGISIVYRGATNPSENRDGVIAWQWNGSEPPLLRTPELYAGAIEIDLGLVRTVRLSTAITFGEIWLIMPTAPRYGFVRPSRAFLGRFLNHLAVYIREGLEFRTRFPRPARADGFWSAPVEMHFEAQPNTDSAYRLPCWLACQR